MVQRLCNTARYDTTSEQIGGNTDPGTPVIVSMSGDVMHRNQGGTVEYIIMYMYPTPDYVRGRDYFFASAIKKEETKNGKRKSVHF